ncbi:GINS complex subunit [Tulasnella sp. JGI-2019a]|nr:GINS complex subunit [Tulasnella sp. JGI-2019a]
MDIDDDQAQEIQLAIDIPETPIARLIRAWTDERHAPDLLVFQGDLLDGLLQRLHEQAVMVTHLQTDPNTTEEEHLRLTLVMTDMERVKFMVRSYVRVRLHKIEKYAPHIMGNPRMQEKLSVAELTHAQRYRITWDIKWRLSSYIPHTGIRRYWRRTFTHLFLTPYQSPRMHWINDFPMDRR